MTQPDHEPQRVAGRLLAAMPVLQDPNFAQSLIYVADHDDKGALGLVLNRPLDKLLGDVASGPVMSTALERVPLHYGGPVQRERVLLALFEASGKSSTITCRLGLPLEQLEAYLAQEQAWVRAFLGYAGWGEGQLDREIKEGAWKICRPDPALFSPHLVQGLWPFFVSGDQRWKTFLTHLPKLSELN